MIAILFLTTAFPFLPLAQSSPLDLKVQSAAFKSLVKGKGSENEMIAMVDAFLERWQGNLKSIQSL